MKRSMDRGPDVHKQKRRSSILKPGRVPRTPLAELDVKPISQTELTVSRRVSFSKRTGVAEFITHEATTTWKNFYEEQHNNTTDSLVNTHSTDGPRRSFEGDSRLEIELEAVDRPQDFELGVAHEDHTAPSLNLTEPFTAFKTLSHVPRVSTRTFEVSAVTDNNFKPFGDEVTEFMIGERSGVIEVDLSAVQSIHVPDISVKDISVDLKDIIKTERGFSCNKIQTENFKSEGNPVVDGVKAAMPVSNTVKPPNLNPPVLPRTSRTIPLSANDWVTDKENILLTPSQKSGHITNINQEEVLVFDGKKLLYGNLNDNLNHLSDPVLGKNINHDHKPENMSVTMGVARQSYKQRPTLVFDEGEREADISITQCVPSQFKDVYIEKKDVGECQKGIGVKAKVSVPQVLKSFRNDVTVLRDDMDMSITRCIPSKTYQEVIQSRNSIGSNIKSTTAYEADVSITRCLPPGLRSSVISSILGGKISNPSNKHTIVFDKDSEISTTQCVNGPLIEHNNIPDLDMPIGEIGEIVGNNKNRRTILFEKDDMEANMSVTQCGKIHFVENKNNTEYVKTDMPIGEIGEIVGNNKNRRTILFEKDDMEANMSVTQCGKIHFVENKNNTEHDKTINSTNRRCTILFERDDIGADMSVTHCDKIHIVEDENNIRNGKTFNSNNSKRIILYEQDDIGVDMSVTQCGKIDIAEDKNESKHDETFNRTYNRHTISLDQDDMDGDMSVTQCVKTHIVGNKENAIPNKILSNNNKRTILLEQDDVDANMSITQCADVRIFGQKDDTIFDKGNNKNRRTILFEQDDVDANMSVTQCAKIHIIENKGHMSPEKIINSNDRRTILFEQDDMNADISVTQCVGVNIAEDKDNTKPNENLNNKLTNRLDRDDVVADMLVTQCVKMRIAEDKDSLRQAKSIRDSSRRTILFEEENINVDNSGYTDTKFINHNDMIKTSSDVRRTILPEKDDICENLSSSQGSGVQILGVKNVIKTGQVGDNNGRTIVFENDDIDEDFFLAECDNMPLNDNEHAENTTDKVVSDNAKRKTILYRRDNVDLSMTQNSNVRMIGDKSVTYVDKSNTNDINRRTVLLEKDDMIAANISIKEPIQHIKMLNSSKFENTTVDNKTQDLNEINTSSKKIIPFKNEVMETVEVNNESEDINNVNGRNNSSKDLKSYDTIKPHINRKPISLKFERDDISTLECESTKATCLLQEVKIKHLVQDVETKSQSMEVDNINKLTNRFEMNEPQALTVCAPVHVTYKPEKNASNKPNTIYQKHTYDADIQTNRDNKHTSQDNDAPDSSKRSVLNQLLDMSTDTAQSDDEQEYLEEEEEEVDEESVPDEYASSRTTSIVDEPVRRYKGSMGYSPKREVDSKPVSSVDSVPRTATSDTSFTTSDDCADTLAAKLGRVDTSKFERRTSLNRRFESAISPVSEDPNDTAELLSELDKPTDTKSINRSHRVAKTVDSSTITDNADSTRRSIAVSVDDELEIDQRPHTEDSAVGPDAPDESSRRRTLRFRDELYSSNTEKDHNVLSPLKKSHHMESSITENTLQRGIVIPGYLRDVSDGVKELMSDLMKPMVDVMPHTSICAAPMPEQETRGDQADIAVSSQVSSLHNVESVEQTPPGSQSPPTTNSPASLSPPLRLRREIADAARRAVNRALHRPAAPASSDDSLKSSRSEEDRQEEAEDGVMTPLPPSPARVIVFDHHNPLNNVLLRPYVPSETPSANPSAHDNYCMNESMRTSREAIDPNALHYCPKHGNRSKKAMDIGCVTVQYDMQNKDTVHHAVSPPVLAARAQSPVHRAVSPSVLAARPQSPVHRAVSPPVLAARAQSPVHRAVSPPVLGARPQTPVHHAVSPPVLAAPSPVHPPPRVTEVKETEVNTLIAMKTNTELLHAESELTVADAGDPLTVTYCCRGMPPETSESDLNLTARPSKRPHVTPITGTPSPRPPQKVHRRPLSPQTLANSVLSPSPTPTPPTSASPPPKRGSPRQSSDRTTDKSSDKMGSFTSSREQAVVYEPVYVAPAPPPGNLRAQIDALPFMGSKDCEWESAVTRAERGEARKRGAWWWFRLLHSRLRFGVRIAHTAGSSPEGDAVLAELVVRADLHGCRDPVISLCVRLAAESARAICAKEAGATAGRTPLLLQRLATVSRLAAKWARAMHDARIRLALAIEEHGGVSFKVANVPLRCVWEVRLHVELASPTPEMASGAPWPRAVRVSARLASPGTAAALTADELQSILAEVPQDWGHVPTTVWRVFRYLKNKTRYELLLGV